MTLHVNLVTTKHKELQNSKDDPNVLEISAQETVLGRL